MPKAKSPPKRKPRPKPPTQPVGSPVARADWGRELVPPWGGHTAGVRVDEFTALKCAAVFACVRFIATGVAQTDFNVYESLPGGGKAYRPDDPIDWILDRQANPETTAMVFWETMIAHALLWPGGYAEITADYAGRPQWMWQITPDRVKAKRDRDGGRVYEVTNDDGTTTTLPAARVFHLHGLSWDGQVGYDVARLCREVFGVALAAQEYASAFFQNDTTPGGILTTDQALSQPAIDRILATWPRRHQGPDRAFLLAVLEQGLKFQPLSGDAEKSQLTQTQSFSVEQVARIFGVPLSKIAHTVNSGSRANLEEEDRAAYKECLRPWARKIECEADVKLFGRQRIGRLFTLHDFRPLLRGNTRDLTDHVTALVDRGILDINEARDEFDLNPLSESDGGKKRLFPLNFTTLEHAGEVAEMGAKPGGAGSGDSPGTGSDNRPAPSKPGNKSAQPGRVLAQPGTAAAQTDHATTQQPAMPAQVRDTFAALLADAYGRLLRVEADKARRAGNREELGSHIAGFYTPDGHERCIADAARPILAALLVALGRPPDAAAVFAAKFAEDHARRSVTELCEGTWAESWANGRAAGQALDHLRTLWETLA